MVIAGFANTKAPLWGKNVYADKVCGGPGNVIKS